MNRLATATNLAIMERGAEFYRYRAAYARHDAEDLKNCITASVPPSRPLV